MMIQWQSQDSIKLGNDKEITAAIEEYPKGNTVWQSHTYLKVRLSAR